MSNLINITELNQSFKDLSELQAFATAQHKTIVQLSKKIAKLEEEKKHLEKLISETAPVITGDKLPSVPLTGILTEDEECIVRTQLRKLRDLSLDRELTLEEAKRVEIYYKILNSIQNKPKTIMVEAKRLSDDQLLAALNQVEETKTDDRNE